MLLSEAVEIGARGQKARRFGAVFALKMPLVAFFDWGWHESL